MRLALRVDAQTMPLVAGEGASLDHLLEEEALTSQRPIDQMTFFPEEALSEATPFFLEGSTRKRKQKPYSTFGDDRKIISES